MNVLEVGAFDLHTQVYCSETLAYDCLILLSKHECLQNLCHKTEFIYWPLLYLVLGVVLIGRSS